MDKGSKSDERAGRLDGGRAQAEAGRCDLQVQRDVPRCEGPSHRGASGCYLGCGTMRMYGLTVFHPPGNRSFASSSFTAGTMITS